MQYLLDMFWLKVFCHGLSDSLLLYIYTYIHMLLFSLLDPTMRKLSHCMRCQWCQCKYLLQSQASIWSIDLRLRSSTSSLVFSKAILNFVFYSYHLFFHSHQSTQLLFHSTEAQHLLVDSEPFAHLSQLLLHTRQLLYQLHRHSGHGGHGHRSHGGHGRHRCWHGCCGRRWWDQSGEQALARRRDGNTERRGRWNRIKKQDDTTVTRIPFQKEPAPNSERPNKSQNKATSLA